LGYSGNSNVISAQDSVNGNWTYTYDAMNRLVTSACAGNATAKCPDGTAAEGYNYLYDRFGNRWQQNLTAGSGPGPQPQSSFDANNHMIGQSYDAAGNVLNDGMHNYVYDAENRIIEVDSGSTAVYTYDAEGRRVRKVAGTTVDYVYDHGGHELAEVGTSGAWTREEVYVGGRHLATYSGTTTYFHNADWLGTERVRTDVNGDIYETCQGLPYGDGQVCVGGEITPMHLTGKHRDTETNLDDFPARYYSSTQGRWLSPDWDTKPVSVPYAILGDPQTLNLYSYVGGDPTNHADPDGHFWLCPWCKSSADSSSAAGSKGSGTPGDKPQSQYRIIVVYDSRTSKGTLYVVGGSGKGQQILLQGNVVVGGDGHLTPTGSFTAGRWEVDHTSRLYGALANTPWSKSILGLNAFGPYQLHINELEEKGIYVHGTMGPGWSPTTAISGLAVSETSHGCVRMCNRDDIALHTLLPHPEGTPIKISTNSNDAPEQ